MKQANETRATYFVPIDVKKAVHLFQASHESPTPPSETACYTWMLRQGLAAFSSDPNIAKDTKRINKASTVFSVVGLVIDRELHEHLKMAAKQIPQSIDYGAEPVSFRYIDLAVLFFRKYVGYLIHSNL